MKSEVLNRNLNYVVFTKRAKAVSDFDVEEAYEKYKNFKYIEISNMLLLDKFRVGVKRKEIPQFNLIIEDLDGEIYEDICTEYGNFDGEAYKAKVLGILDNNLDILCGFEN